MKTKTEDLTWCLPLMTHTQDGDPKNLVNHPEAIAQPQVNDLKTTFA